MNTLYITIMCIAAGPFSSAIQNKAPKIDVPKVDLPLPTPPTLNETWVTNLVDSTTIDLPVITQKAFERVAPANYVVPVPTKRIPLYCPVHRGYSCGMTQVTEDLLGHLQAEHNVTLEYANEIGRERWQDLHDNLNWELESDARKQLFLNPQPAQQTQPVVKKSGGCPGGNCPTSNYSYERRLFR